MAMTCFASGWTRHRDVKTGKTWWQPINCLIRKDNTSAANCLDFFFFFFLEPLWCQGWVNFLSSPPKKKKKKKKLTGLTEERIGFDRSQPSFIGTHWRGKQREEEEDEEGGRLQSGRRSRGANKWCENTHRLAQIHMRPGITSHDT